MKNRGVTLGLLVVGSLVLSLVAPGQPAGGVTETDGGFEDGTAGFWQGTEYDGGQIGDGSIQAVMSPAESRFGQWYGRVTYTQHGGGAVVTLSDMVPGIEYTTEGYLKDPTASGIRFRAGVEGAESASHTNAYEEGGIYWAELDNVTQGNGSSTGSYQEFVLDFVAAEDTVRIFVIFEDTYSASGVFFLDDWTTDIACGDHCDCPQGEFCHRGKCRFEPDNPVYKCDQTDSPCKPGGWCVECDGRRSVCGANPDWNCGDACDCGPGWCCKDGECFKDTADPWLAGLVGGEMLDSPCVQGVDATYCQDDPECWAGQLAYLDAGIADDFRCFDPDTGEVTDTCLTDTCFFDCEAGLTCLDLRADDPRLSDPGTLTTLLGGGCVSTALAQSVFGWAPSDLLSPCSSALPGEKCIAGWRPGDSVLIERIVGEGGSCGNGTCDFLLGETSANCPDCACGDGFCDTSEVGTCTADCGQCDGDGCEQPVMPLEWTTVSACGDGVCQCDGAVAENGGNCPDCADEPDFDSDGLPDKCDGCPVDPTKTEPGVCGCGQPETDTDGDGALDCMDNCPDTANADQADFDGDGIGDACDADIDGDGVANGDDFCPWTLLNYMPDDLKKNRYFADAFGQFVDANGTKSGFTIGDTYGCGELQIIDLMGLGLGHERFGITRSVLLKFVEQYQERDG